jgi:hypothetical protein
MSSIPDPPVDAVPDRRPPPPAPPAPPVAPAPAPAGAIAPLLERLPGLALPVIGGLLVTCMTLIWLTSSLWFFTNVGSPGV